MSGEDHDLPVDGERRVSGERENRSVVKEATHRKELRVQRRMREPGVCLLFAGQSSQPRLQILNLRRVIVAPLLSLPTVELPQDALERSKSVVNGSEHLVGTLTLTLLGPGVVAKSGVVAEESFEPADDEEVVEEGEEDGDGGDEGREPDALAGGFAGVLEGDSWERERGGADRGTGVSSRTSRNGARFGEGRTEDDEDLHQTDAEEQTVDLQSGRRLSQRQCTRLRRRKKEGLAANTQGSPPVWTGVS